MPLRLVATTPKTMRDRPIAGVYLITDQQDNLLERVAQALVVKCGSALQYRAKDKPYAFCLEEGSRLKQLCSRFGSLYC